MNEAGRGTGKRRPLRRPSASPKIIIFDALKGEKLTRNLEKTPGTPLCGNDWPARVFHNFNKVFHSGVEVDIKNVKQKFID